MIILYVNKDGTTVNKNIPQFFPGTQFAGAPMLEVAGNNMSKGSYGYKMPPGYRLYSHFMGDDKGFEFFIVSEQTKFKNLRKAEKFGLSVWEVVWKKTKLSLI